MRTGFLVRGCAPPERSYVESYVSSLLVVAHSDPEKGAPWGLALGPSKASADTTPLKSLCSIMRAALGFSGTHILVDGDPAFLWSEEQRKSGLSGNPNPNRTQNGLSHLPATLPGRGAWKAAGWGRQVSRSRAGGAVGGELEARAPRALSWLWPAQLSPGGSLPTGPHRGVTVGPPITITPSSIRNSQGCFLLSGTRFGT